jgi:hypothetical protein
MSDLNATHKVVKRILHEGDGFYIALAWIAGLGLCIVSWIILYLNEFTDPLLVIFASIVFFGCNVLVYFKRREIKARAEEPAP